MHRHLTPSPNVDGTQVRIAGAGPAGLRAVCLLVEAGAEVAVFDCGPAVRSKEADFSAGLWTYGGQDALEELDSYGVSIRPFATAQTTIRRSPQFENVLEGPAYYILARGSGPATVERQLFDRAERADFNSLCPTRPGAVFGPRPWLASDPKRAGMAAAVAGLHDAVLQHESRTLARGGGRVS